MEILGSAYSAKLPSASCCLAWFPIPLGNKMLKMFSYHDCNYVVISFLVEA